LRIDQKERVGYAKCPFYDRNSCQTFLAYRDGEIVGRIAGILNLGHIERYKERRGFFGFFECRDDQEAANGLFDAVRKWFAEQDIHMVRGPTNPSLNYELGTLIEGFDSSPMFMMTYNPPYYGRLIENYGFKKTQDMYAFWGHIDMLPKIGEKLKPICEQIIERYNVKLRPLDTKHFREDVAMFLDIYNRSLTNTWGFVPMSPEELRAMANGLKYVIVPELTVAAEVDGRVVGATFGMPDYNPRIRDIDGSLFPFGFIHLLRNRRAIKSIRVISTNVLPEYQLMGIGLCLMHGLVPKAIEFGLKDAEFSWVLESNSFSYGALKKGGAKITKTYRIYDIDEPLHKKPEEKTQSLVLTSQAPLVIREVKTAADLDRFVKMPRPIYANIPQWVPPLEMEVKKFLDRKTHPFYQHGEATQFIAVRGNETIGRILASDDPIYNKDTGENVGCFGMFECVDDRETAHSLFDAAAKWLRARGRTTIRGPIDYSLNYPCGLLVDGFETAQRVFMNHNRTYYADLIESWGFKKGIDLYAWWFDDQMNLQSKWKDRMDRLAQKSHVVIRPFRMNDFDAEVASCLNVYNAGMKDLWGFVRLTEAEFAYLAKQLREVTTVDHVLVAEVDGKVVGFSIALPDINEAIRPLNGRLTKFGLPIGLLTFLRRKRHIKTARMFVLDVLEKYRRRGIAEQLVIRTLEFGKNVMGYTSAELGWTQESNVAVNALIEAVGGRRYKTYRVFEKTID
jgi:GNAT superfamily N-acetyltransferase